MLPSVVVDFPLRGEWISPQTPGTRIPSHETNLFGERYAYDFVGIEPGSRRTGSISVSHGDKVFTGQRLANVGHSGNSTKPHLHFHIMDHLDPWKAQGILCCFRDYEVFQNGAWRLVQNGNPKASDRIRKL